MQTNTKYYIAGGIFLVAVSFGLGYYATPNKVVTKEVVKTQLVQQEAKTRIVYREKVTSPDGTITEKENEREDTKTDLKIDNLVTNEKSITKDAGANIALLITQDAGNVHNDPEYALTFSKRVIGAVSVNGMVTSEKRVGLGFGWSF